MMHYGLENQGVVSIENINKPFYGVVETCFEGMDYYSYLHKLRKITDDMIVLVEKKFETDKILLRHL